MRAIFRHFYNDIFFRSSAILFIANFIVNVLNYLFSIFTARMVSVEIYGEFTTLMSLLLIFLVPSGAINLLISREISSNIQKDNNQYFLDKIFKETVFIAFLIWLLFIFLIPILSVYLKIDILLLILFSFLLPLSIINSFQVGYFQGKHNFLKTSILSILSTLTKLILSLFFLFLGFSIYGIIFALNVSIIVSIFFDRSVYKDRKWANINFRNINFLEVFMHFISSTFFTTFLLAILLNIDVIFAKLYLSATEAGSYGALSTIGKIIIFASGSFVTVMMPIISSKHHNNKNDSLNVFMIAFASIFMFGISIVTFFNLNSDFVVHLMFGQKYSGIISYLSIFSFSMFFITLIVAFVNYFLAIRNKSFVYFLSIGILFETLLLWYNHASIREFVLMLLISTVFILMLMFLNLFFIKKSNYEKNIDYSPSL